MVFTRIPDFDDTSAKKGRCYVMNIPKPEEDEGVFRGPLIDFEGFLDISERAIREAAREIGMLDADKATALKRELAAAEVRADLAETNAAEMRSRLEQMILENAELVTEVQHWREWREDAD
jgi:hypothetical protein